MIPHLVGEGLHLRPPLGADAAAMVDAVAESQPDLGRWLIWAVPGYTRRDAAGWCEQGHQDRQLRAFHVLDPADGRLLGGVGFHGFDPTNRKVEAGYWVRASTRGRGVAVRAVRVALTDLFDSTTTDRVELIIAVGNHASERVAAKLGATREGTLRQRLALAGGPSDASLHSILRSEFQPVPIERQAPRSHLSELPTELRARRRWTKVLP